MSIFNVNSASFEQVYVSGSIDLSGSLLLNGSDIKDSISNIKNKVQITYFTSSGKIELPSWTKVVKLIAIGGGGAGGGGVAALTTHSISVGGAGGAGGGFGVAYYDKFKTGSNYYVTCLMGPRAIGGDAYTGSLTGSTSGFFLNYSTNNNSFEGIDTDIIDYTTVITASRGGDGYGTSLYLQNIVSGSSIYLEESTEFIHARAEGGAGGWGGYAYRLKITSQSQYNNFYSDTTLPLSIPGATITNPINYGGGKYIGGPGGHGVSLPISIDGYDENANCAPDLPWGSKSEKNVDKQPEQYPSGILKFPWGRKSEPLYQVNYDKPNNIAPTGGGGGTGWVTSSITIQTGSVVTGSGGNLNTSEPILTGYEEYTLKCIGGSGGNLSNYNGLSGNETPTTGSGPGVGGGGGSSSSPNGTPQSGANGSKGLGIIICIGDNLDVPIDQK
jgi:hypothetical protein